MMGPLKIKIKNLPGHTVERIIWAYYRPLLEFDGLLYVYLKYCDLKTKLLHTIFYICVLQILGDFYLRIKITKAASIREICFSFFK